MNLAYVKLVLAYQAFCRDSGKVRSTLLSSLSATLGVKEFRSFGGCLVTQFPLFTVVFVCDV